MKRKLAIAAAKWLTKHENREKVKSAARNFKSRIEQDHGLNETRAGSAKPEHASGQRHGDRHEGRPRSNGDRNT